MSKTVTKTKSTSLFIAAVVLIALTFGCKQDETPTPTAAAAVEPEEINLTNSPDLFTEPLQPNPLAPSPTDVVATVEGKDITHGEIMQAVQMTMSKLSRQVPPQKLSQMYGQVYKNMTDTLIANILLNNAAEASSLAVSDAELDKKITEIKAGVPEGQSLEDILATNKVDFSEWKKDLRSQMLVSKLVEEKTASVEEATPVEAATFYQENLDAFKTPESVRASHILIAVKPDDTDATKAEKKAKIIKLKNQIAAGASFETVAAENSDCPSSQRGGDLGSFSRGQMVPEFEKVAFTQEVGTVSDVVETQFGYHLIKVTDHQPESTQSLSEVSENLINYLTNQKKQKALADYIGTLRKSANIVLHKQNMDAGESSTDSK